MVFPFTKKKKKKNDLSSGLLWVMNKSLWYDYRKYFLIEKKKNPMKYFCIQFSIE